MLLTDCISKSYCTSCCAGAGLTDSVNDANGSVDSFASAGYSAEEREMQVDQ